MNKINSITKISLLSLTLFGILIFGMLFSTVAAITDYKSTLVKGTEEFVVNQYDDSAWKTTVNISNSPSEWFEGNTNITGSKSKTTIKGSSYTTWQTYDVLTSVFMPEYFSFEEMILLLGIMESQGYNETTINANYTKNYILWYGLRAVWNFTYGDFEEKPSYIDGIFIFQNPSDFKRILDDYNNLAAELNGNFIIQTSGYTFPILNADDFLWQLVLNGLAIGEPQQEYITTLINELGCENASVNGSTLIIEHYGIGKYIVEISYGSKGTISSFMVKDDNNKIIFQIVSSNSEWIFYIVLTIAIIASIAIIVFLFLRSRKVKRR